MATLARPPADITPKDFFETWLPREHARLVAEGAPTPPDVVACVRLDGEGGGAWTLTLAGGQLSVTGQDGQAGATPDIIIEQSVEDWRAVTAGAPGDGPDLSLPEGASLDGWLTNPALHQALQTVKGTLRFEIPGFHGRTFAAAITFQGAAEPQATISIDMETISAMRAGTLPPAQAFFSGKILMSGDTAFAMQIGMALMSQQSG